MMEYKLTSQFFSLLRRRLWIILGVVMLIFIAVIGYMFMARASDYGSLWLVPLLTFVFIIVVAVLSIRRTVGQQERSWSKFRIVLDEAGVTRLQDNAKVRITYGEISSIRVAPGGSLTILTVDRSRCIIVPQYLERFDELRQELAQRHPLEEVSPARVTQNKAIVIGMYVLTIAAVILFFAATNRYLIIGISVALLLLGIIDGPAAFRNPPPGLSTRRMWFGFIFCALLIVARLLVAIFWY